MKKDWKNYIVIVVYGLILIAVLLGFNNLYGSNTDWISQHSVIPDYFRKIFYETGNLVPDLAINIGAGQNIFNYSYYGLLSPVILVSYIMPFISMTTYIIIASIILYLLSGILMYRFIKNNFKDNKMALFLSLAFISLTPLTYHFHHHIMFVWYIPFLLMALIGVDRYVEKNKSLLLVLGVFLMIMTNYYYSVVGIVAVLLYGAYKLLEKKDTNVKTFIIDVLKASIRVIIPLLLAGIILIPSAYVILGSGRLDNASVSLSSLIYPNIKEVVYKSFSLGISAILLLAPFSLICTKKRKASEIFLGVSLIILTLIPVFMYAFNGFLYVRGKALIPLAVLYIYVMALFIKHILNKNINYKLLGIIGILLIVIAFFYNYHDNVLITFAIDIVFSFILIFLVVKYKKAEIIYIPLLIMLVWCSWIGNKGEGYVSLDKYQSINSNMVDKLLGAIDDDGYYRTSNYNYPLEVANKYYNEHYYSTTIYSSNYNSLYRDFYNFTTGNNIVYRNAFVSAGEKNELFNNIMGIKYVISEESPGMGYELIAREGDLNLYYNPNYYPLVYGVSELGSKEIFDSLNFPYNIDYLLKNPIVNGGNKEYESSIQELNWDLEAEYSFQLKEKTSYKYLLSDIVKDKYLIVTFDMDYNESCSKGDTTISINGEVNKLTCRSWRYHNHNNHFEYVLSSDEGISELDIEISKGRFIISDIHVYTMDYRENSYQELDNLYIDKKHSRITGEITLEDDGYVISSIPYEEGFKVKVDGKDSEAEIVNEAFVGFKVSKGYHEVIIEYHSPGKTMGLICSTLGLISLIVLMLYEKFEEKIKGLFNKYREIIMYLIFGVLTTIVSIGSYFIFTHTFLDAYDSIQLQIANILAWIISVCFAYITNRKYVFDSKNEHVLKEISSFFSSRILTLLIDMTLMALLVSLLNYNDTIAKVIVQIIVIIGNYILSKLIVFKKEK